MSIEIIVKKLKSHLNQEELSELIDELESNPERTVNVLKGLSTPKPLHEIEEYTIRAIDEIKDALKDFGEYNYYDKDIEEVMSISHFVEDFKSLGMLKTQQILLKVLEYKHGEPFCRAIIHYLDNSSDLSDEEFNLLLDDYKIARLY